MTPYVNFVRTGIIEITPPAINQAQTAHAKPAQAAPAKPAQTKLK